MDPNKVGLCIAGMVLVTFLPRFLPLLFLSSRKLPHTLVTWLRFVPAAVICSMLLQWLFYTESAEGLSATQVLFIGVSLPAFVLAYATRNFLATVVCGSAMAAMGRLFLQF
jgi:branched-subunit amino acid transport protein